MKKTIFIFGLLVSIVFAYAQSIEPLQLRQFISDQNQEKGMKTEISKARDGKDVVYYEGFESTSFEILPLGWESITTTSSWGIGGWQSYSNTALITGIEDPVEVYAGSRGLCRSWAFSGTTVWAFTCPISLKGGSPYKIDFWYRAPGYPNFNEYDNFEVKIGKDPTPTGMASAFEVFKLMNIRITQWTLVSQIFTPSEDGIYYLAFHCLNPPENGLVVTIDNISIEGDLNTDCLAPTDFVVEYTVDCKAELSWKAAEGDVDKYEVYRDGMLLSTQTTTSYTDNFFDVHSLHLWGVRAICESGLATELVSFSKEPCVQCLPLRNFNVNYNPDDEKCAANLSWDLPLSLQEVELTYIIEGSTLSLTGIGQGADPRDMDVTIACRFTPTDFALHGIVSGQIITSLLLGMGQDMEDVELMEVTAWEGGTSLTEPGEVIGTPQQITIADYPEGFTFELVLDNPIIIDATKELRIGHRIKWPKESGCYPLTHDDSPGVFEKGNLMYHYSHNDQYVWTTTEQYFVGSPSYNWFIVAVVEKGDATIPEWKYDIYRNNELIQSQHLLNTYVDEDFDPLKPHTWVVTVECLAGGNSAPSSMQLGHCLVGIEELVKTTSFSIKPNPATNIITITAETAFNKAEVVNFLGQTVISHINSAETADIDVSNLTNGVYFVRIISDNGTSVQKFVKQ